MKYLLIIFGLLLTSNLKSQYEYSDDYSKHISTLYGQYSIFLGDKGAQYDNGLGIGGLYEYRIQREFSLSGQIEYQRWSDVRNGSENYAQRNFIENTKLGVIGKFYIPAPQGFDAYFGGGLSYNLVNYLFDLPDPSSLENNRFIRTSSDDNSLGIDFLFGVRTGIYENIKTDINARLGWLGLSQDAVFIVGFSVGVTYEFDY